uniref:Uncharacterized protein n=1 Tax=Acrobeloides nanus TaxID=290746 RepID=A0A914CGV3_9BILA
MVLQEHLKGGFIVHMILVGTIGSIFIWSSAVKKFMKTFKIGQLLVLRAIQSLFSKILKYKVSSNTQPTIIQATSVTQAIQVKSNLGVPSANNRRISIATIGFTVNNIR